MNARAQTKPAAEPREKSSAIAARRRVTGRSDQADSADASKRSTPPATAPSDDATESFLHRWYRSFYQTVMVDSRPYFVSVVAHAALFPTLALICGTSSAPKAEVSEAPHFEAVELVEEKPEDKVEELVLDPARIDDLQEINIEPPPDAPPPPPNAVAGLEDKYFDDSKEFEEMGGGFKNAPDTGPLLGGGGVDFTGLKDGPRMRGPGGLGRGPGNGNFAGVGGSGSGFGGRGKGATFFKSAARGNKFVFMIDDSTSMGQGRFETALKELQMAVDKLTPKQYFYVFFFSDTSYGLFWPQAVDKMVPATDANKKKLAAWLTTAEMCSGTHAEGAIRKALAMNPSAIYLLGDGAFADKTIEVATDINEGRIPIHVFGMEVNDVERQTFEKFAKENRGTYRDVEIDPAMAAKAAANPIKRNRSRGSVWGVTLP